MLFQSIHHHLICGCWLLFAFTMEQTSNLSALNFKMDWTGLSRRNEQIQLLLVLLTTLNTIHFFVSVACRRRLSSRNWPPTSPAWASVNTIDPWASKIRTRSDKLSALPWIPVASRTNIQLWTWYSHFVHCYFWTLFSRCSVSLMSFKVNSK